MESNYRLVQKNYFCYMCRKKGKKMIPASDIDSGDIPLICDYCGEGFCEIIESNNNVGIDEIHQEYVNQGAEDSIAVNPQDIIPPSKIESNNESPGQQKVSLLDQLKSKSKSEINEANSNSILQESNSYNQDDHSEEMIVDEESSQPDAHRPPKVTIAREDFKNINTRCDKYGRPLDRLDLRNSNIRIGGPPSSQRRNLNINSTSNQNQQSQNTNQGQNRNQNQRRSEESKQRNGQQNRTNQNPFQGFGNFMQNFFGGNNFTQPPRQNQSYSSNNSGSNGYHQSSSQSFGGPGINININSTGNRPYNQSSSFSFGGNNGANTNTQNQQSSSHQNRNQAPGSQGNPQQIFDQFFRPFRFTSMFNDENFRQMQSDFSSFNPQEFGMNYNQNFRSSMNMGGPSQNQSSQQQSDSSQGFSRQRQNSSQSSQQNFQNFMGGNPFADMMGGENGQNLNFENFANIIQEQMMRQQEDQNRNPTNQNVIRRLPVVDISENHCKKKDDGSLEMPTCSVCITDFEIGQKGMFLPCGHTFHPDCIKPWLENHNTCPVCRKELPSR